MFFQFCTVKFLLRYSYIAFAMLQSWAWGQEPAAALFELTTDPVLLNSKISILAIDIKTGDTLLKWNPKKSFATASTTKLFTTALAYELLGPSYQFQTGVYADAPILKGTLTGNLWVKGGGDVTLGSKFFNADGLELDVLNRWADSLIAMGLHEVKGNIIIDGSDFGYNGAPLGWSAADLGNYYGAFPAGINWYDNILKYYFATGKPGTKAKLIATYPKQSQLYFNSRIVSARIKGDHSNVYGYPYDYSRSASGRLPAYKSSYMVKGSIPDPELNFAEVFRNVLVSKGILLTGEVKTMRLAKLKRPDYDMITLLLSEKGRNVDEIATWTNERSVNFFAEGLLNGVGYKITGDGTNASALNVEHTYWGSKIDTSGLRIFDGSGLSRENKISASHFCELLKYMYHSPNFNLYFASLPTAGVSGTIRDLCNDQMGEGKICAKSGSMTGIKSYAGYIHSLSGRDFVFAVTVNGFTCATSHVVSKMEKILNSLSGL